MKYGIGLKYQIELFCKEKQLAEENNNIGFKNALKWLLKFFFVG